jgi:beta-phosphoglucomutase-like phosphatase (HAD superfamily)
MTQDSRPQGVVFDLDGLMFNTEDLYDEVSEMLLQRRGCRLTADLKRRMMGLTRACFSADHDRSSRFRRDG